MAEVQKTSLQVGFGNSGDRYQKGLVWEMPYQVSYGYGGAIILHLYPAVNASLRTSNGGSIGYASSGTARERTITAEYLRFNGTQRVKTKYPAGGASGGALTYEMVSTGLSSGSSGVTITKVWSEFYDEEGKAVNPTFSYDFETGEVVSSVACYGAIKVTYKASYRVVEYRPNTSYDYKTGFTLSMDTVVAFYKGAVAMKDIEANIVSDAEQGDLTQVAEVYSEIVVDEQGAWEQPDNFPDAMEVKYNSRTGYSGPSRGNFLSNKRISRTLYADVKRGRLYEHRSYVTLEQPFSNAAVEGHWFKPAYKISSRTPAEASADLQLEINKRVNDLKTEFGIA